MSGDQAVPAVGPTEEKAGRPIRLARWVCCLVAVVLAVAATLAMLNTEVLPLGAVRAEDLAQDYGLLTWNFWAVTESALRGQNPYETKLLFHPLGSNLAAHTLGPGFLPVGLAARAARGGAPDYPLHARRLAILLCFALGLLLSYRALRAIGADVLPAAAAAVGWGFAGFWHLIVANPTLASACFLIPCITLACVRLVDKPSTARAVTLAALVSGSVFFSEYFSAFIALALLIVTATALAFADTRQDIMRCASHLGVRGLGIAAGAGLLVALPFLLNWTSSEGRPPRERQIVVGGANLAGFVIPNHSTTPLYSGETTSRLHAQVTRGRAPFLGVPTLLLAGFGLAHTPRRLRRLLLTTAASFFVLSLGPLLKVLDINTGLPLPYALLRYIPPFDMARDPQRLAVFGIWALVCFSALGLTALARRLSHRVHAGAGIALGTLALAWWAAEGYRPGPRPMVFTPPPELVRASSGAVANFPLHNTDGLAMFMQVFHGRPMVTGYVSRTSDRQHAHVTRLQRLLTSDPRAFGRALRSLGVDTLILQPGTGDSTVEAIGGLGFTVLDLRSGVPLTEALPAERGRF